MAIKKAAQTTSIQAPVRSLGPAEVFTAAVAVKRSGDLDGALKMLGDAIDRGMQWPPMMQARAGYTALAGDKQKARELMDAVPKPPNMAPGEFNGARVDYSLNLAWFSAILGDDDAVAGHIRDAIQLGGGEPAREHAQKFVAGEPDVARLKDAPAIKSALACPATRPTEQTGGTVDAGNPAERASVNDFAAKTGTPATGSPLMQTRIAAMTGKPTPAERGAEAKAALGSLATLVPSAQQAAGAPGTALGGRLLDAMHAAQAKGERFVHLDTGDLRSLVEAGFGDRRAGMDQLTSTLEELGYKASYDGFSSSLSIVLPEAGAPTTDKTALLDGLRSLQAPAAGDDVSAADAVAQLVRSKIDQAAQSGEAKADLDTGELDRALSKLGSRSGAYGVIAEQLEQAGFKTFADGFIGVSLSWDAPGADAGQTVADLRSTLPKAEALGGSSSGLAGLVQQKIDAALAQGEQRADLDTSEIDPLLKGSGVKYGDVASALEQAGFKTFADGFVGVSLSWE
jgi:hypothetical protein